ncbi:hypothetical protein HF319_01270 [Xanthomonas sp. Kuri4-1]
MRYKILNISIAVTVLVMMVFGVMRLINGDESGKPDRQQLLIEMSRLQPAVDMSKFRYVNKLTNIYITAHSSGKQNEILGADPLAKGWELKGRKSYEGGEVVTYCRRRLALLVDTSYTSEKTYIGIYWTFDRGSGFYCP